MAWRVAGVRRTALQVLFLISIEIPMATPIEVEPIPAPPAPAWRERSLIGWLYNSNPFYIISAGFVFFGLRMSFDTRGETFATWALMLGLTGYTLLLATTACLLIRFGNVWDDMRTLLLLVVLMLLATSVTFDDTLASNPRLGRACYLVGLAFAVGVSEALLRGIRLRLPLGFRVPYYLILALFFLYPVALSPLITSPGSPALHWALFGFSPLAGLTALGLLPAIRRGPGYADSNGSPWRWPLYPWVLFGLLGVCIGARSYSLCVSFHFVLGSRNIFGPYFLEPFLLAVGLLLLEIGLVARSRAVQQVALAVPLGLLALAVAGHRPDPLYQQFLAMFLDQLGGSPLFLTLLAAVGVYAWAMLRRVPLAAEALALSLAALSVVGPGTVDLDGLIAPRAAPLVAVAALQLALALRRRESWRGLMAAGCLVAAVLIGPAGTWMASSQIVLGYHLMLAALLLLGVVFDDPFARFLQGAGAVLLMVTCLSAVAGDPCLGATLSPGMLRVYPLLLAVIAATYGTWIGSRLYLAAAAVGSAGWLVVTGWWGYASLRRLVIGLDQIALGLAFFLLATLISLMKAGAWQKWAARRPTKG